MPYSEGIGFIADLSNEETIDYVTYVTAHEVGHQWWGHQVVGANQQGSTLLVEIAGAILGADGDGEDVRPRQDPPLPQV